MRKYMDVRYGTVRTNFSKYHFQRYISYDQNDRFRLPIPYSLYLLSWYGTARKSKMMCNFQNIIVSCYPNDSCIISFSF